MAIAGLNATFSRLTAAGLSLSESVKAMILLQGLPQSWDSLAMTILSNTDPSTLTIDEIAPKIQDEYCRRQGSATSLASCLSTVQKKRKNKNSWYKQKKQKTGDNTSVDASKTDQQNSGEKKNQNSNGGGKKRGKGKKAHANESNIETPTVNTSSITTAFTSTVPKGLDPYTGVIDPILVNIKQEEVEPTLSWADQVEEGYA